MNTAKMFAFPVTSDSPRPRYLRPIVAASFAGALALGISGCKSNNQPAPIVGVSNAPNPSGDPADANLAPVYNGGNTGGYSNGNSASKTRVLGQSQSFDGQAQGESYPQGNSQQGYPPQGYGQDGGQGYGNGDPNAYGDTEQAGEEAMAEADQPPPPLPQYDQPPAPEQNDLWTPGYWGYAQTGYYWVPGAWCAPPFYGALWTPGYWGYYGGHYGFHHGYWGAHVGYYGGINYGFGYIGTGYFGGYWRGHDFLYNRAVTNVNVNQIHNVYDHQVSYNGHPYGPLPDNRVSYNGGRGGVIYQPRPYELAASREAHYAPVAAQRDLRVSAASNRAQFAGSNGGRPAQAFAARPVGTTVAIASTPREQPFNHPGNTGAARPGQPGALGSGAGNNRPAVAPGSQSGLNGGRPGQPGAVSGQPARNGLEGSRPGAPQGQALNNRPAAPSGVQPGGQRGEINNHHQTPQASSQNERGTTPQPEGRTAAPVQRQAPQQSQQRAAPQAQTQARPTPQIQQRPQTQIQQRPTPQVQQPQYQQRSSPQVQQPPATPHAEAVPQARPQAAPAARPAPEARPAPAAHPAPAPHAAAGGDHGHH